jgi:hypothetical protein
MIKRTVSGRSFFSASCIPWNPFRAEKEVERHRRDRYPGKLIPEIPAGAKDMGQGDFPPFSFGAS